MQVEARMVRGENIPRGFDAPVTVGSCHDSDDGTYACVVAATVSGSYELDVYQLVPGGLKGYYQLMSLTYRICFISLPIPVTGPEGPSKFIVLSWELAFYEISFASQNHVEVGHHQIAASGRDQ